MKKKNINTFQLKNVSYLAPSNFTLYASIYGDTFDDCLV